MNLEVYVVWGNGYCVFALYAVCLLRIAMWDALQLILLTSTCSRFGNWVLRFCIYGAIYLFI
jgi:hypothetical protein